MRKCFVLYLCHSLVFYDICLLTHTHEGVMFTKRCVFGVWHSEIYTFCSVKSSLWNVKDLNLLLWNKKIRNNLFAFRWRLTEKVAVLNYAKDSLPVRSMEKKQKRSESEFIFSWKRRKIYLKKNGFMGVGGGLRSPSAV